MNIESRQLRHLAAIGRNGTFVSAAKALGMSQPALSLSIQRLEDILKVSLVERGRNGATLTEAGRLLACRSEEMDETIAAVVREIELTSQGIKGKLRIGGTPLATHNIIPATISVILEQTKDVAFEIVEATDEVTGAKLRATWPAMRLWRCVYCLLKLGSVGGRFGQGVVRAGLR